MSDIYGIGNAMKAMTMMYQASARRTGRTTHLVDIVKPGDMVIFAKKEHLEFFKSLLRERKKEHQINLRIVRVNRYREDIDVIRANGTLISQLYFDHSWIELFYAQQIGFATDEIYVLQESMSRRIGLKEPQPMKYAVEKFNRYE